MLRTMTSRAQIRGRAGGVVITMAITVVVAIGAAGCGNAGPGSASPTAVPSASGMPSIPSSASTSSTRTGAGPAVANDTDTMFAQMMIPHHQQAVQMSDLLLARSGLDPRVKELANQIKSAQAPEITTMTGWLRQWGQPTAGSMSGMDHGGADGMLTASQLAELRSAGTARAQTLYLTGMIGHHRGAVAMAQTEIEHGSNADAVSLAHSIVRTQDAEITTMTALPKSL